MKNQTRFKLLAAALLLALVALTGCTTQISAQPVNSQMDAASTEEAPATGETETGATAVHSMSAPVQTHPSQGDVRTVEGGQAQLHVTENGAMFSFRTDELVNGHVYTAWWVVVNNAQACPTVPCAPPDILGEPDLYQSEVTYGDGILVGDDGRMEFAGYLPTGAVAEPWIGNGFTNPVEAEIHIVINDHGPFIPEMASTMLNSYRGGCTDESLPGIFPDTAIADGEPGPNKCALVQFAVFDQLER